MNDLWVHYSANTDSDMGHQIREVVESSGGKWYGTETVFPTAEGNSSFTFDTPADFERAVGGLAKALLLKW